MPTGSCPKKAFRELRVSVCGRFCPNEGGLSGLRHRCLIFRLYRFNNIIRSRFCHIKVVIIKPDIPSKRTIACYHPQIFLLTATGSHLLLIIFN
ncbi:DUF6783 domain-containing protein [Fusicatenibacter sp.]